MILSWNHLNGEGRIARDDFNWCDIVVKPELGFQYLGFMYSQDTNEYVKLNILGVFEKMTTDEMSSCAKFIEGWNFKEETSQVCDKDGLYIGKLPVSQISSDHIVVKTSPPREGYMWNIKSDSWDETFGILENGSFVPRPNRNDARIIFTREESHLMPPSFSHVYDFEKEKWYDPRSLDDAKGQRVKLARQFYDKQRANAFSEIGAFGFMSLSIQYHEASSTVGTPTPFIDRAFYVRDNDSADKEEYKKYIIDKYNSIIMELAHSEGKMLFKIDEIGYANTVEAVDGVQMD